MPTRFSILPLIAALALPACASQIETPPPVEGVSLELYGLESYEASLGQAVRVYGQGFPLDGRYELIFDGEYRTTTGSARPVNNLAMRAIFRDAATLSWDSLGPYSNPFGVDEPGSFFGTVQIHFQPYSDTAQDLYSESMTVDFEVRPSVIVREFQPVTANCQGGQVRRALAGLPYRLGVEVMGMNPETITYTLSVPEISLPTIRLRHIATATFDEAGEEQNLIFPDVPDAMNSYLGVVTIETNGFDGSRVIGSFATKVHRPIEIYYNGNYEIAQRYTPEPVSGCTAGGEAGREVRYSEGTSLSLSRNFSTSFNSGWNNMRTFSEGSQETVGRNFSNGIGFGTTDSVSWRWDAGGEIKGEVGLLGTGTSASARFGVANDRGTTTNRSQNSMEGLSESQTTTESESYSNGESLSRGESLGDSASSSSAISSDISGRVIAGTFGVWYRQATRIVRRGHLVAYNLCGEGEIVSDAELEDWLFAVDLALGNSCDNFPASNLPPAECFAVSCSPLSEYSN